MESWDNVWIFVSAFTCSIDEWNSKYLKPETLFISPSKTHSEPFWSTWHCGSSSLITLCLGRVWLFGTVQLLLGWENTGALGSLFNPRVLRTHLGAPGFVRRATAFWLCCVSEHNSCTSFKIRKVKCQHIVCNHAAWQIPGCNFSALPLGMITS